MRYAVYYMPDDNSSLGRFGARLFGRWPDGRTVSNPLQHPEREVRVGRAARYGFHATLKAPFRLAPGCTASELHSAVGVLATECVPVPLESLHVERYVQGSDTWALCCATTPGEPADRNAALPTLAARCVRQLDELRSPLEPAERARRRPAELSPDARERLERWGYPWVLDGFRFHMTLARAGAATTETSEGAAQNEAFEQWLKAAAATALAEPAVLDRLAISVEDAPGAPFRRIAEFALRSR